MNKKYLTKSEKLLIDFAQYCYTHPEERFWQALKNWSGAYSIQYEFLGQLTDTFYFEEKNK